MNICIPITDDHGLDSAVCMHFGSAPAFLIVDTDSGSCRAVPNANQHHGHGMCAPLAALQGERIDAMVVGGIGAGAMGKLAAAGIPVHLAEHATVRETVDALVAGTLPVMGPDLACAHHGQGGHHEHGEHHHHGGR
jgi:predicted Fe-Mo cluster-binding NifX family protein